MEVNFSFDFLVLVVDCLPKAGCLIGLGRCCFADNCEVPWVHGRDVFVGQLIDNHAPDVFQLLRVTSLHYIAPGQIPNQHKNVDGV